jgi:putative ABC transport system permease protein
MLLYNLRLAVKSLRRHPVLSSLIVAGIALGVAVATTFITVYHVLAKDPLPGRSQGLHYVRLNSWGGGGGLPSPDWIPSKITYRDMMALRRSDIPTRQTGSFSAEMIVRPEGKGTQSRPFEERARLVFSDFFPMFEVPFLYGAGWDRKADERPEAVAVIGAELNDRLFGGADSVGKTVRLEGQEFRIVGVLDRWRPPVRYYDPIDDPIGQEPEQIYLPLQWVGPMEIPSSGSSMTWASNEPDDWMERLPVSEGLWMEYWVELPDEARRERFADFVEGYVAEQHRLGRFQMSQEFRVTPMMEILEEREVVPPQAKALALISLLFLVVAAVNLVGLFLGKFLSRAPAVGVRRALGASRRAIFLQHLVECEMVALIGGVIGLAMSFGALAFISRNLEEQVPFHLDAAMIAAALLLSLAAGAIAGIYPSWRICAIPPARHLKNQ